MARPGHDSDLPAVESKALGSLHRAAGALKGLKKVGGEIVDARGRKWNPALHPRDARGRFIETGGVAKVGVSNVRVKILKALGANKVLVAYKKRGDGPKDFNGKRDDLDARGLTMVQRPDGTSPTKDATKVLDEDDRRTADPKRGDGITDEDHGDRDHDGIPDAIDPDPDTPNPRGAGGVPRQPQQPQQPEQPAGPRFTSVPQVLQHWATGGDVAAEPPVTEKWADKRKRADMLNAESAAKAVRRPELSPRGHFVVGFEGRYWFVRHAGSAEVVAGGSPARRYTSPEAAMAAARALEDIQVDGQPFDWDSPRLTRRMADTPGLREAFADALDRAPELDRQRNAPEAPAAPAAARRPAPAAEPEAVPDTPPAPETGEQIAQRAWEDLLRRNGGDRKKARAAAADQADNYERAAYQADDRGLSETATRNYDAAEALRRLADEPESKPDPEPPARDRDEDRGPARDAAPARQTGGTDRDQGDDDTRDRDGLRQDRREALAAAPAEGVRGDEPDREGDPVPAAGRDGGGSDRSGVARTGRSGRARRDDGAEAPAGRDGADDGAERRGEGAPAAGAGDGGDSGARPVGRPADSGDGRDPAGSGGRGLKRYPGAHRFQPHSQDDLAPASVREKAKANIAALRLLKQLEKEDRPATADEQKVLARWAGWGALSEPMFGESDSHKKTYAEERAALAELMTPDEMNAARRNTLNAHYTDAAMVEGIWEAVRDLGFDGDGQVLEPGSGSGTFMGFAPEQARMVGVELDPITAQISQYLYPDAKVFNEGLQDFDVPPGTFDVAIGNVPFSSLKPYDRVYNPRREWSLHNYAIVKAVDQTRPGGVVAVLTSSWTMDSRKDSHRKAIYDKADLVGAVRLPSGAHRGAAGTDVVTDLLIFRRRKDGESPGDSTWLGTEVIGQDDEGRKITANKHFTGIFGKKSMVLGEMKVGGGLNGRQELIVEGDPKAAPRQMRAALRAIAHDAREKGLTYSPADEGDEPDDIDTLVAAKVDAGEASLRHVDGKFQMVRGGRWVDVDVPKAHTVRLRKLVELGDVAEALLAEDRATDDETPKSRELRARLNKLYDAYVAKHGAINDSKWVNTAGKDHLLEEPERRVPVADLEEHDLITWPGADSKGRARKAVVTGRDEAGNVKVNVVGMQGKAREQVIPAGGAPVTRLGYREPRQYLKRQTPPMFDRSRVAGLVAALESYDAETNTAKKGSLLTKRALRAPAKPGRVDDPADAIAMVLDRGGQFDLDEVARLMGVTPDEAREKLGDRAFLDPVTDRMVSREEYLSGDVRKKLRDAEGLLPRRPDLAGNVEALKEVVPEWMGSNRIKAALGASWIPADLVQDFIREITGQPQARVQRIFGARWAVRAPEGSKSDPLVSQEWGTKDKDAFTILDLLLHRRQIKVTRTLEGGGTMVDREATDAAQTRADKMAEAFKEWIWADPDRAENLLQQYNDTFNGLVKRQYSDAPMRPDGLSETYTLYPHQAQGVRRIVNEPAVLLAHEVGAGKTLTVASAAMELRRLGHANKPAIVVPNHMKEQWQREFLAAYPQAKVLAVGSDDLDKKGRKEFLGKVAAGDWDAVVFTEEAFESIQVSKATHRAYIDKQLEESRKAASAARKAAMEAGVDPDKDPNVKKFEKMLADREERLKKKLDARKDDGMSFEQLGIDYAFVDEAHRFKNLERLSSTAEGIQGSDKASDLDMKLGFLRETNTSGRYVTFATATPVANSMGEVHTMLKYLRPELLEAADIHDFDTFLANFAVSSVEWEMTPDGGGWAPKERLRSFYNMPGLLRMWQQSADVMTSEDLDLDIPDIDGETPELVIVPTSAWLRDHYTPHLVARAESSKGGKREKGQDNILVVNTDGKAAALDPRMVGGPPPAKGEGKLAHVAAKIAEIHAETKDNEYDDERTGERHERKGALQVVFLDQGTPGAEKRYAKKMADIERKRAEGEDVADPVGDTVGFDAYAELKRQLIEQGIPEDQIAFIHDAANDQQKAELFAKARDGRIAVIVGSTEKMGVGTNIQTRAVAMHHVDVPYRPADLQQRDGRVVRQKNQNGTVRMIRYATEGSVEVRLWDGQERKAKMIQQVMRGDLDVDEVEEISTTVLSAAEMKAASSGNELLLNKVKTDADLNKLRIRKRDHLQSEMNAKATIQRSETGLQVAKKQIGQLEHALSVVERDESGEGLIGYTVKIGDGSEKFTKRLDANAAIRELVQQAYAKRNKGSVDTDETTIGRIGGLAVTVRPKWNQKKVTHDIEVRFPDVPSTSFTLDKGDMLGVDYLTRFENALDGMDRQQELLTASIPTLERNRDNAKGLLGRDFKDQERLDALEERAKRLTKLMDVTASRQAGGDEAASKEPIPPELLTDSPEVEAVLGKLDKASDVQKDRPAPKPMTNVTPEGERIPRTNSWMTRRREKEVATAKSAKAKPATREAKPDEAADKNPEAGKRIGPVLSRPFGQGLAQVYETVHGAKKGETRDRVLATIQKDDSGQWAVFRPGQDEPEERRFSQRADAEAWAIEHVGQQAPRAGGRPTRTVDAEDAPQPAAAPEADDAPEAPEGTVTLDPAAVQADLARLRGEEVPERPESAPEPAAERPDAPEMDAQSADDEGDESAPDVPYIASNDPAGEWDSARSVVDNGHFALRDGKVIKAHPKFLADSKAFLERNPDREAYIAAQASREAALAGANSDWADIPSAEVRPGDIIEMPTEMQGSKWAEMEVVRVAPFDSDEFYPNGGVRIEYRMPKQRRYSKMATSIAIGSPGQSFKVKTQRARDVDSGAHEVPEDRPLDFNQPPMDGAEQVTPADIGHGQEVAFPDPKMPNRWIHGTNDFPTYTEDGQVAIAVREGDGGLMIHRLPADAPIWKKGRSRKGYERPDRYKPRKGLTDADLDIDENEDDDAPDAPDAPEAPEQSAPDATPESAPDISAADQARIQHAVEDWAGKYAAAGDPARYVTEGHLKALVDRYGYEAVRDAVQRQVDAGQALKATTEKDRAENAARRKAAAAEFLPAVQQAREDGDLKAGLAALAQAEQADPDGQDWDRIRERLRTQTAATRDLQAKEKARQLSEQEPPAESATDEPATGDVVAVKLDDADWQPATIGWVGEPGSTDENYYGATLSNGQSVRVRKSQIRKAEAEAPAQKRPDGNDQLLTTAGGDELTADNFMQVEPAPEKKPKAKAPAAEQDALFAAETPEQEAARERAEQERIAKERAEKLRAEGGLFEDLGDDDTEPEPPARDPETPAEVEEVAEDEAPEPDGAEPGGVDAAPDDADDAPEVDETPVSTPEKLEGEKHAPTVQQQRVIDAALDGKDVLVQAKAGAGKTSTLEAMARRIGRKDRRKRIAYVAFNSSVQTEAQGRMPSNVESRTGHSIAFVWAPKWMQDRFDLGKKGRATTRADEVARTLGITEKLPAGQNQPPWSVTEQAMAAQRAVGEWANSADDELGRQHLPERAQALPGAAQDALVKYARKAWEDITSEGGRLKVNNDHMRKLWALSRPDLTKAGSGLRNPADVIFLDEAQDTPPVLAKVIADQTAQKIIVGDADQAIYGFTGATDYLSTADGDVELPLNKSWRFGPQVADMGNRFLQLLGSRGRVIGAGEDSRVVEGMQGADAVLVRSNGGAVKAIIEELDAGRTVGVPKGTRRELRSLAETARYLKGQGDAPETMHEDLAPFRTWAEVEEQAEREQDPKLKMLVKLVQQRGIEGIEAVVDQITENGDSPLAGVQFVTGETGLRAEGRTYDHKGTLREAGFRFLPLPGFPSSTDSKNKRWTAPGSEEQQEAALDKVRKATGWVKPDVIVSTAHKAKGLEWDRVRIGDDFFGPKEDADLGAVVMPPAEELRLAYVAVTRAQKELDMGSLGWVLEHTDTDGGKPDRKERAPKAAAPEAPAAPEAAEAPAAPEGMVFAGDLKVGQTIRHEGDDYQVSKVGSPMGGQVMVTLDPLTGPGSGPVRFGRKLRWGVGRHVELVPFEKAGEPDADQPEGRDHSDLTDMSTAEVAAALKQAKADKDEDRRAAVMEELKRRGRETLGTGGARETLPAISKEGWPDTHEPVTWDEVQVGDFVATRDRSGSVSPNVLRIDSIEDRESGGRAFTYKMIEPSGRENGGGTLTPPGEFVVGRLKEQPTTRPAFDAPKAPIGPVKAKSSDEADLYAYASLVRERPHAPATPSPDFVDGTSEEDRRMAEHQWEADQPLVAFDHAAAWALDQLRDRKTHDRLKQRIEKLRARLVEIEHDATKDNLARINDAPTLKAAKNEYYKRGGIQAGEEWLAAVRTAVDDTIRDAMEDAKAHDEDPARARAVIEEAAGFGGDTVAVDRTASKIGPYYPFAGRVESAAMSRAFDALQDREGVGVAWRERQDRLRSLIRSDAPEADEADAPEVDEPTPDAPETPAAPDAPEVPADADEFDDEDEDGDGFEPEDDEDAPAVSGPPAEGAVQIDPVDDGEPGKTPVYRLHSGMHVAVRGQDGQQYRGEVWDIQDVTAEGRRARGDKATHRLLKLRTGPGSEGRDQIIVPLRAEVDAWNERHFLDNQAHQDRVGGEQRDRLVKEAADAHRNLVLMRRNGVDQDVIDRRQQTLDVINAELARRDGDGPHQLAADTDLDDRGYPVHETAALPHRRDERHYDWGDYSAITDRNVRVEIGFTSGVTMQGWVRDKGTARTGPKYWLVDDNGNEYDLNNHHAQGQVERIDVVAGRAHVPGQPEPTRSLKRGTRVEVWSGRNYFEGRLEPDGDDGGFVAVDDEGERHEVDRDEVYPIWSVGNDEDPGTGPAPKKRAKRDWPEPAARDEAEDRDEPEAAPEPEPDPEPEPEAPSVPEPEAPEADAPEADAPSADAPELDVPDDAPTADAPDEAPAGEPDAEDEQSDELDLDGLSPAQQQIARRRREEEERQQQQTGRSGGGRRGRNRPNGGDGGGLLDGLGGPGLPLAGLPLPGDDTPTEPAAGGGGRGRRGAGDGTSGDGLGTGTVPAAPDGSGDRLGEPTGPTGPDTREPGTPTPSTAPVPPAGAATIAGRSETDLDAMSWDELDALMPDLPDDALDAMLDYLDRRETRDRTPAADGALAGGAPEQGGGLRGAFEQTLPEAREARPKTAGELLDDVKKMNRDVLDRMIGDHRRDGTLWNIDTPEAWQGVLGDRLYQRLLAGKPIPMRAVFGPQWRQKDGQGKPKIAEEDLMAWFGVTRPEAVEAARRGDEVSIPGLVNVDDHIAGYRTDLRDGEALTEQAEQLEETAERAPVEADPAEAARILAARRAAFDSPGADGWAGLDAGDVRTGDLITEQGAGLRGAAREVLDVQPGVRDGRNGTVLTTRDGAAAVEEFHPDGTVLAVNAAVGRALDIATPEFDAGSGERRDDAGRIIPGSPLVVDPADGESFTPGQLMDLASATGATVQVGLADGRSLAGHLGRSPDGGSWAITRGDRRDTFSPEEVAGIRLLSGRADVRGAETTPDRIPAGARVAAQRGRLTRVGRLGNVAGDGSFTVTEDDGREHTMPAGTSVAPVAGYSAAEAAQPGTNLPAGAWRQTSRGALTASAPGQWAAHIVPDGRGGYRWQVSVGGGRGESGNADTPEAAKAAVARVVRDAVSSGRARTLARETPGTGRTAADQPSEAPAAVAGMTAEWAPTRDLNLGDQSRVNGMNHGGQETAASGHVLGMQPVLVRRNGRLTPMLAVTLGEDPAGQEGARQVVLSDIDSLSARVPGNSDKLASGESLQVLAGRLPSSLPRDGEGRGLFPGSLVKPVRGDREGIVTAVRQTGVSVHWGNDDETDEAGVGLLVTDGGIARPAGWTRSGEQVAEGMVVEHPGPRGRGTVRGTVQSVDGDSLIVAGQDGVSTPSAGQVTVLGKADSLAEGGTPEREVEVGYTPADQLADGDVLLLDGADGRPFPARVVGEPTADGYERVIDYVDTRTGETGQLVAHRDEALPTVVGDLGDPGRPVEDVEVQTPVAVEEAPEPGRLAQPPLLTVQRELVNDLGLDLDGVSDEQVQQAAARLREGLPLTQQQSSALAGAVRAAGQRKGESATGRGLRRAADVLDASAGEVASRDLAGDRGQVVRAQDIAGGDHVAIPRPNADMIVGVVTGREDVGPLVHLTVTSEGREKPVTVTASTQLWRLPDLAPVADDDPDGDEPFLVERPPAAPDPVEVDDDARSAAAEAASAALGAESVAEAREAAAQAVDGADEDTARAVAAVVNETNPLPGEQPAETNARMAEDVLDAADAAAEDRARRDRQAAADQAAADAAAGREERSSSTGMPPAARDAIAGTGEATAREVERAILAAIGTRRGALTPATRMELVQLADAIVAAGQQQAVIDLMRRVGGRPGAAARLSGLFRPVRSRMVGTLRRSLTRTRNVRDALRDFTGRIRTEMPQWEETRALKAALTGAVPPARKAGALADGEPGDLAGRVDFWTERLPAPGLFGMRTDRGLFPTRVTEEALRRGDVLDLADGTRVVLDTAADGGPGKTALRHLDALRGLGRALDDDVTSRVAAALPQLGKDPHTAARQARAKAAAAERRWRDLFAVQDRRADRARQEMVQAQAEADRVWAEYSTALAKAVRDAIAEHRPVGPKKGARLDVTGDQAAVEALRWAEQHLPTDWLAALAGHGFTAADGDRGWFDPATGKKWIADLGTPVDGAPGGGGSALHEVWHHLQTVMPEVSAAEWAYLWARTSRGDVGARRRESQRRLSDLFPGRGHGADEVTREDSFADAYLGREYPGTGMFEVGPMGIESLLAGSPYLDDDLRGFVLGLLMWMGRNDG